jgi:hypothetical protein
MRSVAPRIAMPKSVTSFGASSIGRPASISQRTTAAL